MWTATYWKRLAEDAVQGFAAGVLSVTGLDAMDVLHLDFRAALGVGLGGALVVILKGLVAKNVGNPESPSVVK
jgi:hypothetical protein